VIRLAVRVQRAQAEIVLAELLELAPAGVEETQLDNGAVEYAVYGAPGELPSLPDLKAAAGSALVEITTSELADDWHERWRRFHRPILIEPPRDQLRDAPGEIPALYVRPPWESAIARRGPVDEIVIDPGQAFGTGAHATTRLCLELLLELCTLHERGPLLDLGTGSGVLAIAAARLGFAPVLALDHEPESVRAARENARVNGVEIAVERLDVRREKLPLLAPAAPGAAAEGPSPTTPELGVSAQPPPVVLANLLLPLLLELASTIDDAPRHLIASGMLRDQADEVADAFRARHGLRELRRLRSGEWAALWLGAD
jgi:ribosomal protein L11 methyltransferase